MKLLIASHRSCRAAIALMSALILSGCTVTQDELYLTPELPELLTPRPPPIPSIDPALLVPCFLDLMPVVSDTQDLRDMLRADVKTFNRQQRCYIRQLNLIEAVKAREKRQN